MPQNKDKKSKPPANEFGKIRSYLAKNRPTYMTPPEWNAAIKTVIKEQGDLTRGEIAERLRAWMREFPKG